MGVDPQWVTWIYWLCRRVRVSTQHSAKVPVTHVYFHYDHPRSVFRQRRYVAYQMEYAENKLKSKQCKKYMTEAPVAAWEYTKDQLQYWHGEAAMPNVMQVSYTKHGNGSLQETHRHNHTPCDNV